MSWWLDQNKDHEVKIMKQKIKVLYATDFSPSSKNALPTLELLKRQYQAEISLIYVITSFWKRFVKGDIYEKAAKQRLLTWQQTFDAKNEDTRNLYVKVGNAAETIIQMADLKHADLIVLGSESEEHQAHLVTGTTAEAIVRGAKQSVLLCKSKQFKSLLCGIDGSANSLIALTQAVVLCVAFDIPLTIVHVYPRFTTNPLGLSDDELRKAEEDFANENKAKIEELIADFDFKGVHHEVKFLWGMPSEVMINLASDYDIDLIVVGATGESYLKQVLLGSTSEKILRKTPCSLLVIR